MKVLIGTPAYDHQVTSEYMLSVLALLRDARGVRFGVDLPSTALLPYARNALATKALETTHLLFIDSDIGFRPDLIHKMLAFDQPFVGCLVPHRSLNADEVVRIARERPELENVRAAAQAFIGEVLPGGEVRGDFVRAARVGTGMLLLKREVLERIREAYPELWMETAPSDYRNLGLTGGVLQCFTSLAREDGLFLGEDYSFCKRWTDIGGEIWACISEEVTHVGRNHHRGTFREKLTAIG